MTAYEFVRCNSCGWHHDLVHGEAYGKIAADHTLVCDSPQRWMMAPMWSIAWPWIHGPKDTPFGIEIEWRPLGSHTAHPKQMLSGMDAKEWHAFPWPTREMVVA